MKTSFKKKSLLLMGVCIILVIISFYYFDLHHYLSLSFIKQHQSYIQHAIQNNYYLALLIYGLMHVTFVFFMIPFTLVLTTVAGFFFGTVPTIIVTVIGALIGSVLFFLVVRHFSYTRLNKNTFTYLQKFKEKFKQHGSNYILSLHFLPVTPFSFINAMAALSNVPLTTFMWTTTLGVLPTTTLCAFAGHRLATITSTKDIITPLNTFLLILLAIGALLPILLKKFKKRS